MKEILSLSLESKQIRHIVDEMDGQYRVLKEDFGFVRSLAGVREVVKKILIPGQPYRLLEGRYMYLRTGTVSLRVNLRDKVLTAPMLVILSPGTVVEVKAFSEDCDLAMLTFRDAFMDGFRRDSLLQAYLRRQLHLTLPLQAHEQERMEQLCGLFWDILHDEPPQEELIKEMILVFFKQADAWRQNHLSAEQPAVPHREEVLNRFIDLVNDYAVRERRISFYADKLCLTPHYLSAIIRETSRQTIMDWINRAVIQEAKLLLLHSDLQITQIADRLHFPNASFFCKYFRRLTGTSPGHYRMRAQ